MLATRIMNQRWINIVLSLDRKQFLVTLQEYMTIHELWANIQNRNHYFVANDMLTYPSPKGKSKPTQNHY